MRVCVEQEDIAVSNDLRGRGTYIPWRDCPTAIAVKKLFPDKNVCVGQTGLILDMYDWSIPKIDLPRAVTDWIKAYDAGKPVSPIDFELHV